MAGFPINGVYLVMDPKTKVVHRAQAWDAGSHTDAIVVHATYCNIEINGEWPQLHQSTAVTCLECVTTEDV